MPTVQVVGVGKEWHTLIGQWGYLKRQHPNVTRATMGPMALCQRTLDGDATGTQFLRETHQMALFRCRYTTPWRKAGGKRGAREYAPDSAWAWRMSGLTRDGTAEPVSRDQILRRERGQGKIHFFPVQLTTSRIEDPSAECDDQHPANMRCPPRYTDICLFLA